MRKLPCSGAHVQIAYLGVTHEGVIEEVQDQGRRVLVLTEEGEELTFILTALTGRYMADGAQTGARLLLGD
jgi:hypothetical protein